MQEIEVGLGRRGYRILIGAGVSHSLPGKAALGAAVRGRRALLVSDSQVSSHYGDEAGHLLRDAGCAEVALETFEAGEASKHLRTVETLYHAAIAAGADRRSVVVALGGGVTGDIAGFVAATLYRGIDYVQMPTSLLAMVDSSVGGKVGVDLAEGKNLVGAFHQPRLVLADLDHLRTLPDRELRCGLAEVVKYGMIMDESFFAQVVANAEGLRDRDLLVLEEVVAKCCALKADVVERDEREGGLRAILNYGHTFGHALETIGNFTALNHGEAVAIGMGMAVDLASALGLVDHVVAATQDDALRKLGLPLAAPSVPDFSPEAVLRHMYRDKKVVGGRLRLVLPHRIGEVEVMDCDDHAALLTAIGGRLDKR